MGFVLGVDAGGTKTIAVIADETGQVHGIGKAGSANFQACGVSGARGQIQLAIQAAARKADVDLSGFQAVCYGISGADRPVDFDTVRNFTLDLAACPVYRLENDTIIALRAGTPDGVGIALIAGTGSNAIGRNADGAKLQVGGIGRLSGDFGSAGQLGEAAIVAALMGLDGRGLATGLADKIKSKLGLAQLEDIIEYEFFDSNRAGLDLGSLAPLIFEAADEGDQVALALLEEAGINVARGVRVILEKLFSDQSEVTIVFGGSIFQKGSHPKLIETISRQCRAFHQQTRFVRLEVQPALGAIGFAFDDLEWPLTKQIFDQMRQSYKSAWPINPAE
ncbi:MAG: hypothetical protein JRJ19_09400 [Deltaproteobacteria bacterium]|nr:hypothetical protein [Deltaproteobacteria bacterium]MBW1872269.1 hypothetical protein [Deltaproteobacteria bacterium]